MKPKTLADLNCQQNQEWSSGVDTNTRHSSLADIRDYDAGYHRQKADRIYYVRALLFLCVVYLLWVAFHESLHYAVCAFRGSAYVASVVPTPAIACVRDGALTPYGAFVYYMSPYIAAIGVIALFCRTADGMLRLVPYTAFFDLQYNLFATSLFGGELNGRENDALSLMQQLDRADPGSALYGFVYVSAVAFFVGTSLILFYYGYRNDLSHPRSRCMFIASFLFYTLFYTAGTLFLYY